MNFNKNLKKLISLFLTVGNYSIDSTSIAQMINNRSIYWPLLL